jgi:hypothetical protein
MGAFEERCPAGGQGTIEKPKSITKSQGSAFWLQMTFGENWFRIRKTSKQRVNWRPTEQKCIFGTKNG